MTATKSQPQGGISFLSRETVFLSLGGLTDEMAGGMAYETLEVSTGRRHRRHDWRLDIPSGPHGFDYCARNFSRFILRICPGGKSPEHEAEDEEVFFHKEGFRLYKL